MSSPDAELKPKWRCPMCGHAYVYHSANNFVDLPRYSCSRSWLDHTGADQSILVTFCNCNHYVDSEDG